MVLLGVGVNLMTLGRTSWSAYSEDQLTVLQAEAERVGARIDQSFIEDERTRRVAGPGFLVGAAVVLVAASRLPRRRPKEDREEAARLAAYAGADRYQEAAKLLGVT